MISYPAPSVALLLALVTWWNISPCSGQTLSPSTSRPAEGIRDTLRPLYALQNARVIVAPGEVIPLATIVIDGDSISLIGPEVTPPPGAELISMVGKTIYPGLIDTGGEADPTAEITGDHWHRLVTPGNRPATAANSAQGRAGDGDNEQWPWAGAGELRAAGITVQLIAPSGGIISGTSRAALTGGPRGLPVVLRDQVAQHLKLTVPRGGHSEFPKSPMGAVALLRQTLLDAQWYRRATLAHLSNRNVPAPVYEASLQIIGESMESETFIIDCPNERFIDRADRLAREFSLAAVLKGSGREYRLLDDVAACNRVLLVPIAFPKAPDVSTIQLSDDVSLTELMHWYLAPENPARLAAAGVRFTLTTAELAKTSDFLPAVRTAVQRGLSPAVALAALTTIPAELLGLPNRLGTISVGKLANLVVVDGDLFDEGSQVLETWVAGRRYRHDAGVQPTMIGTALAGDWKVRLSPAQAQLKRAILTIQYTPSEGGKPPKFEGVLATETGGSRRQTEEPDADTSAPEAEAKSPEQQAAKLINLVVQHDRLSATFDVAKLDPKLPTGIGRLDALITVPEAGRDPNAVVISGELGWPDGAVSKLTFTRVPIRPTEPPLTPESPPSDSAAEHPETKDDPGKSDTIDCPINHPLGINGITKLPEPPAEVLFVGATVWTCGPLGVIERGDIRVRNGKIVEVGPSLAADADCQIVDASGMHITPGLIDCHSHIATDGGVNEASRAVTADVRIGDFIDHSDITIYRQLAGGVTTANILHGSANPIGGQNQVIKLRWGADPEGLRFQAAPPGIKFALGENVKRDSWRDAASARYPQSRMGVEQLLRDRFIAAREYDQQWKDFHAGQRQGLPPRRDLRLEALAEVLRGERWIHCHSYRQDEIAALLAVLQEFNVRVGTLQHILEGYKVAEVLADSQAMASTFADWWAYKFEVYDAIPYNASMLKDRGVVVSMNSDDPELGRHLNTEAAKAIKYGGSSDEDALKMVTLNPAKQLRIENHVGSIEPGKDADLVLWSGRPMSTTSRCEQTWIDGAPFFTRQADQTRRAEQAQLRSRLIQAVLAAEQKPSKGKSQDDGAPTQRLAEEDRWPRVDLYCTARRGRLAVARTLASDDLTIDENDNDDRQRASIMRNSNSEGQR